MNVGPGGKQPVMKDTVFDGKVQNWFNDSGIPKGMKLDTLGMNGWMPKKWERGVGKSWRISKCQNTCWRTGGKQVQHNYAWFSLKFKLMVSVCWQCKVL